MNSKQRQLAIEGGTPARPAPIEPLYWVGHETRDHILRIVDSGEFSIWYGGPVVKEFEEKFASWSGAADAVAVNTGHSALHAAVAAIGLQPGDEVVIPAALYVSAASVVVQEGAIPVICDISEETYVMSVDDLRRHVTDRTRAVIVVHFWGCPVNMEPICEFARDRHIVVIEDCGQSHGSKVGDRITGSIGDFGCFSFAPRKHITTGQGGMVICRKAEDGPLVRELVNKGKGFGWLAYNRLGYGYLMPDLSAAIGIDGLQNIDAEVNRRRQAASIYRRVLAETPLVLSDDPPWGSHVYFKMPILLPEGMASVRDFFKKAIEAENVSCRVPHPPAWTIPWLAEYVASKGRPYDPSLYPVAGGLLPRMVEVETGPNMSEHDVEVSAHVVLDVWNYVSKNGHL
jgi:perosamine synthetase